MDPINPNNIFSIDIEATNLPTDFIAARRLGEPFRLPEPDEIARGFAGVDIFQIGYMVNGRKVHVDVTDTSFDKDVVFTDGPLKNSEEFIDAAGKKRSYRRASTTTATREGYDRLFKSPYNRMNKEATEQYKKKVLPHYLTAARKNAQFVLDDGGVIGEMPFGMFTKKYDEVERAARKAGFDYTQITQANFRGTGDGSLYKAVSDLLETSSEAAPAVMRTWNPAYDAPAVIATLQKSGHKDLVDKFINQYKTGLLKIEGIEEEWHEVLYKLLRENKDLSGELKIGMHPAAAAATGRPGMTVTNFDEFKFSTYSWKQDDLARYFKGHRDLTEIAHLASTDILQSEQFAGIMRKIKDGAVSRSGARSFTELMSMEETGNAFTDAFNALITEEFDNHNKLGARGILQKAVDDAHRKDQFFRRNFGSWFAADTSRRSRAKWSKYPGVIGAAIAVAAVTYMGSGDSEVKLGSGTSSINGIPLGSGIESNLTGNSTVPMLGASMVKAVAAGIAIPGITMAAIGYGAAQRHPMMGYEASKPTTFTEAWNQTKKTIRYGVKTAEGHIPLARVFELGSLSDYLVGSRSFVVDEAGNGINGNPARFHQFKVVNTDKNTRITKVLGQEADGHNTDLTEFMHKLSKKNRSQYDELNKILMPDLENLPKGMEKPGMRQIRIASTNTGKTIIKWQDYSLDEAGKAQRIQSQRASILIDQKITLAKLRDVTPQASRLANRRAKNTHVVGTSTFDKTYESMIKYGGFGKDSFDGYLSRLQVPGFAERSEFGNKAWRSAEYLRWMLDLNSKGVGEGKNLLVPGATKRLASTNMSVMVKDAGHYAGIAPRWLLGSMDKFLETPFEFLGFDANKIDSFSNRLKASPNLTTNIAGKVLSAIERPHLGLGLGAHGGSATKYLMNFGLKRVLPAYVGLNAFSFVDHALGAITMSPTGRGPLTSLPVSAFQSASLLYTKLSDITGMTDYAKWQADVAPGSTGIGIFAPAATLTATYFMGEQAYKKGPDFLGGNVDKAARWAAKHPFIKNAMRKEAYSGAIARGPVEKFLSFAIKNPKKAIFGLGMLPAIPFLPGFLGSDQNYMERKAEYDGEKEVAIRKYRGWLLSSSPFGGGRVRSWRRHSTNLMQSDFENRGVLYPSYWDRFLHNASLGLYKPNILEEYHKEAQPVYKSAPWGANVPLIGPLIAGTVGQLVGQKTYHTPGETAGEYVEDRELSMASSISSGSVQRMFGSEDNKAGYMIGLQDPASTSSMASRFMDSMADLSGFRGFSLQTMYGRGAGQNLPDQYTPYAQDASQMYSPAEQMWQYNLGDITVVGGEFLRRILQNSEKKWQVNDIPNELFGVSWIPQDDNFGKDLTHGTTFDKVDMGWLYGARKGWEFLYPGEATGDMESYGAPIRTEILKHIAPYSREFNQAAANTLEMALDGGLDPKREQRFYETLEQVSQVKEQLYATAAQYTFDVETERAAGEVQAFDEETGSFMVNNSQYRLAGVSLQEADIRSRLLQKQRFKDAQELDSEVQAIKQRTSEIMRKHLSPGAKVSMEMATANMLPETTTLGREVRIGDLSEELWEAGAPYADTGNISTHNMAQERHGVMSKALAGYWESMTSVNGYWNKKLISQRDYLDNYMTNQLFNREVKLWTRPIDHILKPFISSTLHNWFGVDALPSFTKERRSYQQHWDVIKYIKYRTMATRAKQEGDLDSAAYYETQWRSTMVGADPTDGSSRDELNALPANERQYFKYFANEPDPEKRGKIFKYLPEPAKRLYSSIWLKKMAEVSKDAEVQDTWERIKSAEGWNLTQEEEKEYHAETGGAVSKGDWARARFVEQYARDNNLPGPEWSGWDPGVSLENTQLISLMNEGENAQDYGFFDKTIRKAVYDNDAYKAATDLESVSTSASALMGSALPYLMDSNVSSAYGTPTGSYNPTTEIGIETNGYSKILSRMNDMGLSLLPDEFLN